MKYAQNLHIIIAILLFGCASSKLPSNDHLYTFSNHNNLDVKFKVYHFHKDSSRVYFRIDSKTLLYTRDNPATPFKSTYVIKYELVEPSTQSVIDSNSYQYADEKNQSDEPGLLFGQFEFTSFQKTNLIIHLYLIDKNRNDEYKVTRIFNKENDMHIQNFLLTDNMGTFIESNSINHEGETYITSRKIKLEKAVLQSYGAINSYPAPPFSTKHLKAEKLKILETTPISIGVRVKLPLTQNGIYKIKPDSSAQKGLLLVKQPLGFPETVTTQSFIEPLKYITTDEEYLQISNDKSPKEAAETFWLELAGSKENAIKLIKLYYDRVKTSNINFTSYKEGWKTDRGLILIIFGPPERVISKFKSEYWYYNSDISSPGLYFTFKQVENQFSNNVYELQRSINYKTNWYRALDSWRAGRPYFAR